MCKLLFNLDKLIWCRLEESSESNRYYWEPSFTPSKFQKFFGVKYRPGSFQDNFAIGNDPVTKEEIYEKCIIIREREEILVMIKPHLRMYFSNGVYYEEYYDNIESAKKAFAKVELALNESLACK